MHFITGKGGVGKSTYAASLAAQLAQKDPAHRVLLVDVQGSGYALESACIERVQQTPLRSARTGNLWGCRILPFDTFKEYFSVLLAMGNTDTAIAQITSAFRDRVVDLVVGNSAISAFIQACPGLEPAVLLGKLEYESKAGRAPGTREAWTHIVVDAPATGHALMLFRSTFALLNVFSAGVVFKQAGEIRSFVTDPDRFVVNLVSVPEELPVAESVELKAGLADLGVRVQRAVLNRSPRDESDDLHTHEAKNQALQRELQHERDLLADRKRFREEFLRMHAECKIFEVSEFISANQNEVSQKWLTQTHLI